MERANLQIAFGRGQRDNRHQLERIRLLRSQTRASSEQECRWPAPNVSQEARISRRSAHFGYRESKSEPEPWLIPSPSRSDDAPSIPENPPRKAWSRTSIRCMRSANPARPISTVKNMKAGSL